MLKTLTLILFPQLNPYHKTSARLALYIQFFGIECRIFNFYLFPISSIRKQLDKLNRIFNLKSATIIQYTIKGRFMSR